MLIIGEKINGTRNEVAEAIVKKDEAKIRQLAMEQAEAGANYLDANAGTTPDKEPDSLVWLVRIIQDTVDLPICIDSPNPIAISAAINEVKAKPIINSISGEKDRLENVLPIVAKNQCPVIALAMSDSGMPKGIEDRMRVIRQLLEETRQVGIPDSDVYVDPLIMAISTGDEQGNIALGTLRQVRNEFPEAHLTGGLSNISFGLPARSLINNSFISLAISAGLDCAITDPCDRDLMGAIFASELLVGKDRYCANYTRAYRAGRFGKRAKKINEV